MGRLPNSPLFLVGAVGLMGLAVWRPPSEGASGPKLCLPSLLPFLTPESMLISGSEPLCPS